MIILSPDYLLPLAGILFFAAVTPGPNNAMVAASGANFGYKRTLPHILGIAFGFGFMIFVVSFALGQMIAQSQLIQTILRWAGAAALLFIAYQIAMQGGLSSSQGNARPFRTYEAAAFQWINPKAWTMALAVSSQFASSNFPIFSASIIAFVSIACGLLSASVWTILGSRIRLFLSTPLRHAWFNRILGLTLFGFVGLILIGA